MGESRPIKVMHIIARMNVGGPAVEIVELMRGLDPQVVSQRLVTGYCDEDEADYLETQAPDIKVTRIQGLGRSIRPTDDARALVHLIKLIRSSRPDIVHTHTAKAGVLGRLAAKLSGSGTKVMHTYHGHLLSGYFGATGTSAVKAVECQLAKVTDVMICVGERTRDDLIKSNIGERDQYRVIRSHIEIGALPEPKIARRELGIPLEAIVVGFVGRITSIKRPDRFAEVVVEVCRRAPWVHFVVAGGGDLESELRERLRYLPVTFCGWRTDVETVLASSDLFLLVSDNEGIPTSLIEASLANVPSVSTDVGSISEVVIDGVTGLLCSADVSELASAVVRLAEDQQLRENFGRSAKKIAEERFRTGTFFQSHYDAYADVSGALGPTGEVEAPR